LGLSAKPAAITAIPATAALPAKTGFGVFSTRLATVAETPERDCSRERFARVVADERLRPIAFEERFVPVSFEGERLSAVAFGAERLRAVALVGGRLRPADLVLFARLLAALLDVPLDDFVARRAIALLRSPCPGSEMGFTEVITRWRTEPPVARAVAAPRTRTTVA
jgi:hypothetical protein